MRSWPIPVKQMNLVVEIANSQIKGGTRGVHNSPDSPLLDNGFWIVNWYENELGGREEKE